MQKCRIWFRSFVRVIVAAIFLCALLGGLIGKAILKKHFVKAGIV